MTDITAVTLERNYSAIMVNRLASTGDDIATLRAELDALIAERARLMSDLWRQGMTFTEIGELAGINRQRVAQILRGDNL